jgi:hypothetical protein
MPATGNLREGEVTFQAGDELYGPTASHSLRLKMLRLVFRATAADKQALRSALDRCTHRPGSLANGMVTWSLPGHHLIALDDGGSGLVEFSASVDQSDIAE